MIARIKPIEEVLKTKSLSVEIQGSNGLMGSITLCGVRCSVVATWSDNHVSVAPYNGSMPTWDMMARLKSIFYKDEEEAYEIHPKKSEYVNLKTNCLHLWGGKLVKR